MAHSKDFVVGSSLLVFFILLLFIIARHWSAKKRARLRSELVKNRDQIFYSFAALYLTLLTRIKRGICIIEHDERITTTMQQVSGFHRCLNVPSGAETCFLA